MKLDVCLMACDDNPMYYNFYPYVKKIWEKKLSLRCILIFVGYAIPDILALYQDDIILFEPRDGMHTAFIAQNIRLLYPAILNCQNGVIISDIDIIPLSKKFFVDQIDIYDNDKFINYRYLEICDAIKEYYMCYGAAVPNTWSKIFGINSIEDIYNLLKLWYDKITYVYDNKYRSKCKGFHNDQIMLYKYINEYHDKSCIIHISNKLSRFEFIENDVRYLKKYLKNIQEEMWDDYHVNKKKFDMKILDVIYQHI